MYDREPATTAHTAAVTTTGNRWRIPRRPRGSGSTASAAGSPAAVSDTATPAGTHDNDEISDDGNAGMAHFGKVNKT
ncbi:MAG TPA: hypothetical protein VFR67_09630 [Pilimelia sp.]|nr:hypothetical protein [Pilimelia sp.]